MNFKAIVWHESMRSFLKEVAEYSKEGMKVKCADGVIRLFYLFVLILSADYEEQLSSSVLYSARSNDILRSMMSLTRGGQASYPCPQCLVHKDDLSNLLVTPEPRKTADMNNIVRRAVQGYPQGTDELYKPNAEEREQMLQAAGLRPVAVRSCLPAFLRGYLRIDRMFSG